MPTANPQAASNSAAASAESPVASNPNRALWEKGDFTRLAATMRESGEELVGQLGVQPGEQVLDLGCGDGTTALPAARRGATVLGVDIASNLVAAVSGAFMYFATLTEVPIVQGLVGSGMGSGGGRGR